MTNSKQTEQKKRRSADELVAGSTTAASRGIKWNTRLNLDDTAYLRNVLEAMSRMPNASPSVVARNLKKELGLSVGAGTIAKTLRELLADDQTKTK